MLRFGETDTIMMSQHRQKRKNGLWNFNLFTNNAESKVLSIQCSFAAKYVKNIKVVDWYCFTVYPKKYAHDFCFAVLCCGYTLTDFPISIRVTSLALWQSNDCPSASKATLMNMDKYFTWIHYERLHNHNKAKHNKTVCIFLGIYYSMDTCTWLSLNPIHALPCDCMTLICRVASSASEWMEARSLLMEPVLWLLHSSLISAQDFCVLLSRR